MSGRKKLTYLTQPEIERFMKAATELHRACCDPLLSPRCDHSRALTELNAVIVTAIEAVTGHKAPWMRPPTFDQHPGYKLPTALVSGEGEEERPLGE
jgi:hypothetical protein